MIVSISILNSFTMSWQCYTLSRPSAAVNVVNIMPMTRRSHGSIDNIVALSHSTGCVARPTWRPYAYRRVRVHKSQTLSFVTTALYRLNRMNFVERVTFRWNDFQFLIYLLYCKQKHIVLNFNIIFFGFILFMLNRFSL